MKLEAQKLYLEQTSDGLSKEANLNGIMHGTEIPSLS